MEITVREPDYRSIFLPALEQGLPERVDCPVIRKNKLSDILPLLFAIAGLLAARFMIIRLFPCIEKFKVMDTLIR